MSDSSFPEPTQWNGDEPDPYQWEEKEPDMPRVGDVFGGNYLKAEDLAGREVNVTIEKYSIVEMGEGEKAQKKLCLHFVGHEKALLCNVTNAHMIEELLGTDNIDEWEQQRIRLYVAKVDFKGDRVPAIRVKAVGNGKPAPKMKPAPKPEPDPETDFDTSSFDEDVDVHF